MVIFSSYGTQSKWEDLASLLWVKQMNQRLDDHYHTSLRYLPSIWSFFTTASALDESAFSWIFYLNTTNQIRYNQIIRFFFWDKVVAHTCSWTMVWSVRCTSLAIPLASPHTYRYPSWEIKLQTWEACTYIISCIRIT